MKKTYSKPYIAVESFQLDAAIASSCSKNNKIPLNYGMNNCDLADEAPGLGYFGSACAANGGYDVINPNTDDNNGNFCYHGPVFSDMFMNS